MQAKHGENRRENQFVSQNLLSNELGNLSTQTINHGNKKVKLTRPARDKKIPSSKGFKTLKHSNLELESSLKPLVLTSCPSSNHGSPLPLLPSTSHNEMGNLAQEQGCSHPRRSDCSNTSSPNGHIGLVQRRCSCSLETHLPDYSNQCNNKEPSVGSPSMGKDTKFVVEVPYRHSFDFRKGSSGVEQAKAAISSAPLGRIELASLREESDRFQGFDVNASGEYPYNEAILDS